MVEPTSYYYQSAGLKLHYLSWGDPQRPTLLLVHGLMDHCRNWDRIAQALASRYHLIVPDLRGHGDSDWAPGAAYEVHYHLYDLLQLVERQKAGPVTLIGHSLGGTIAVKFAGVWPDRVKRLVSIEGLGSSPQQLAAQQERSPMESVTQWVSRLQHLAARGPREYASLEAAAARMQQVNPHLTDECARHLALHGSCRSPSGGYRWKYDPVLAAPAPFDMPVEATRQLWSAIDCPVLLIWGQDSWASDPAADGRMNYFNNARLVTIANAGHWVQHDQHPQVMLALEEFLD